MLHMYDANNYLRTLIETQFQLAPRYVVRHISENPKDTHFFVWDGKGANQIKRNIYPGYKMSRQKPHERVFEHMKLFKEILRYCPVIQYECEGYEADDVIGTLLVYHRERPVVIYSNDYDMEQFRGTSIFPACKSEDGVLPCHVRLYKSMVGDRSDNIKGVPGFGDAAWKKCAIDLLQKIMENKDRNKTRLLEAGVSHKCADWIIDNWSSWVSMYTVSGFMEVPYEQLVKGRTTGEPDMNRVNTLLEEYMR